MIPPISTLTRYPSGYRAGAQIRSRENTSHFGSERLVIIDPISADEIRDRGLLYLKLERFSEAVDDLETYLRLAPDAEDADEIGEQITALKKAVVRLH